MTPKLPKPTTSAIPSPFTSPTTRGNRLSLVQPAGAAACAKGRKLHGGLGEMSAAGGETDVYPEIAEADDIRHPVHVSKRVLLRLSRLRPPVEAAPITG